MKKLLTIITLAAASAYAGDYEYDFRDSSNSPHIHSPDGKYLGNLNNNEFDPNSISNPFGAGSEFRHNGVNNPFSQNYMPELTSAANPRKG